MARMSPDDVRDAIQRARTTLDTEPEEGNRASTLAWSTDVVDCLVELGNIRRNVPRSPLTEEAARLEDRLHALI